MDTVRTGVCQFSVASALPVLSGAELAQELRKAVDCLTRWPGVRTLWLFGSAARGDVLDWRSDLDFAVEGLAAESWGQAWAALDEALRLPVDLVRLETANSVLREAIAREGQVLYEA